MSTSAIVNIRNLNIDLVSFAEPKKGKGVSVSVKYAGQILNLRLPRLAFPGGLLQRANDNGQINYTLMASLKGCDPYAKDRCTDETDIAKLYNFLIDFQEKLIKTATENSAKWFGKKRGEESIRDSFNGRTLLSISQDKVGDEWVANGKYPPSIKMKIPVYDNRVSMEVVDKNGSEVQVTPDNLAGIFPKGAEADLVLGCSIYINPGGFGVTWRVSYARVFPQTRLSAANIFADDEDDGEEVNIATNSQTAEDEIESAPAAESVPLPTADAPSGVPAPAGRKRRTAVA